MIISETPDEIIESISIYLPDGKVLKQDYRVHSIRVYSEISVKRMGRIGIIKFNSRTLTITAKTGEWGRWEIRVAEGLAKKYRDFLYPSSSYI